MVGRLHAALVLSLLGTAGCSSSDGTAAPSDVPVDLATIRVPAGFGFRASQDVQVSLQLSPFAPANGAKAKVRVGFPTAGGAMDRVIEGWLEADGSFVTVLPVASWRDRLQVEAEQSAGLRRLVLPIVGGKVTYPGQLISSELIAGGSLGPQASAAGPQLLPPDLQNYPIAYVSYFPSQGSYGTLAFEDNWPSRGDYDFNDLVVSYHVVQYRNPAGDVVAMEMFLRPEAAGAGFSNGLGLRLPVDRRRVIAVTGTRSSRLNGAGLESNQPDAVTVAFDRFADVAGVGGMVNTGGNTNVTLPEQRLLFTFRTPLKDRDIGVPPFDPFLIVNGDRGREIHLAGQSGTALANAALTGTEDDRGGYRTANGLPWAILLPSGWNWPVERAPINFGHLEFVSWATSGGTAVPDWYLAKPSNRNYRYLFNRLN